MSEHVFPLLCLGIPPPSPRRARRRAAAPPEFVRSLGGLSFFKFATFSLTGDETVLTSITFAFGGRRCSRPGGREGRRERTKEEILE